MKNKLDILIRNSLFNTFNINQMLGKGTRQESIKTVLLGIFVFLIILVYSASYSYMGIEFLSKYNLEHYIPVLFFVAASLFIFMYAIYRVKNVLFDAKDNDMLLSMPIAFRDILASRIINLYIMNLVYSIAMFFPSTIVYGIVCSKGVLFYIFSILLALILPIIPVVLSSLLGFFIALISSKSKKSRLVEIVLTFVMFFAVFFGISYIQKIGMKFVENIFSVEIILKKYLYPIYLVKEVITNNNLLSFVILTIINILVLAIFVLVLNKKYKKILSKLKEEKKNVNRKKTSYTKNSVIATLFNKELKKYFATTVYVFNTAFGQILCIMLTAYILIVGDGAISSMINEMQLGSVSLYKIVIIVTFFIISMTNTTCASISLEGKNLWVLRSLPIKEIDIFKGKILLNILISLPITLICTVLVYLRFKLGILECLINLGLLVVLSLCIAQFGLIINLKFPRLDYVTETQVVKQSFSTFISTFVPMIIVLIGASIFMMLPMNISIYIVLALVVFIAIIDVVEYIILKKWGVKTFKKL